MGKTALYLHHCKWGAYHLSLVASGVQLIQLKFIIYIHLSIYEMPFCSTGQFKKKLSASRNFICLCALMPTRKISIKLKQKNQMTCTYTLRVHWGHKHSHFSFSISIKFDLDIELVWPQREHNQQIAAWVRAARTYRRPSHNVEFKYEMRCCMLNESERAFNSNACRQLMSFGDVWSGHLVKVYGEISLGCVLQIWLKNIIYITYCWLTEINSQKCILLSKEIIRQVDRVA